MRPIYRSTLSDLYLQKMRVLANNITNSYAFIVKSWCYYNINAVSSIAATLSNLSPFYLYYISLTLYILSIRLYVLDILHNFLSSFFKCIEYVIRSYNLHSLSLYFFSSLKNVLKSFPVGCRYRSYSIDVL